MQPNNSKMWEADKARSGLVGLVCFSHIAGCVKSPCDWLLCCYCAPFPPSAAAVDFAACLRTPSLLLLHCYGSHVLISASAAQAADQTYPMCP